VSALLHFIAAFAAAGVALVTIDLLWLGVSARPRGRRASERAPKTGCGWSGVALVVVCGLAVGLFLLAINSLTQLVEAAAPPASRPPLAAAASAPA